MFLKVLKIEHNQGCRVPATATQAIWWNCCRSWRKTLQGFGHWGSRNRWDRQRFELGQKMQKMCALLRMGHSPLDWPKPWSASWIMLSLIGPDWKKACKIVWCWINSERGPHRDCFCWKSRSEQDLFDRFCPALTYLHNLFQFIQISRHFSQKEKTAKSLKIFMDN